MFLDSKDFFTAGDTSITKSQKSKEGYFFVFLLLILSMSSGLANYPDVNWSADRVVSGKRYFRAQRST